ncbi:hypothetical protein ACAG39_10740 [Caldicellulosiruptoraceae bacterium PP1]
MATIVMKADLEWFNNVKNHYNQQRIIYVNYWNVNNPAPAKLQEGDKVYFYVDDAQNGLINIVAEGTYIENIYNRNIIDIKRKMSVKDVFRLYGLANGMDIDDYEMDRFVTFLISCTQVRLKKEDEIYCTLVTKLNFNDKKIYNYIQDGHNSMSAQGYLYVNNINNIKDV